jgi:hypothetical protein
MISRSLLAFAVAIAIPASASAVTIDFTSLANGTAVTNQYPGVVFSLQGGTFSAGDPVVSFGGLSNTASGAYPTANFLNASFTAPVSNVSFTFENYGDNGASAYFAYDSSNMLLDTGYLGDVAGFTLVTVNASNVALLQFSNGTGGQSNWQFAVGELSFGAVPETATWAMLIAGFGLVGATMRRRRALVAA